MSKDNNTHDWDAIYKQIVNEVSDPTLDAEECDLATYSCIAGRMSMLILARACLEQGVSLEKFCTSMEVHLLDELTKGELGPTFVEIEELEEEEE